MADDAGVASADESGVRRREEVTDDTVEPVDEPRLAAAIESTSFERRHRRPKLFRLSTSRSSMSGSALSSFSSLCSSSSSVGMAKAVTTSSVSAAGSASFLFASISHAVRHFCRMWSQKYASLPPIVSGEAVRAASSRLAFSAKAIAARRELRTLPESCSNFSSFLFMKRAGFSIVVVVVVVVGVVAASILLFSSARFFLPKFASAQIV